MKKSRFFALILSAILLICAVSLIASCGDTEKNENIKLLTEQFIDAVLANDADTAYAAMSSELSRSEFDVFFSQLCGYFASIKSYELTQTGWQSNFNNGVSSYIVTFNMVADNGLVFEVTSTAIEGYENLANIHFASVTPSSEDISPLTLPLKMGFFILSIATIAFCVWMIVDCAKRKLNKKALWIILILIGASISLVIDQGIRLNFMVGITLFGSSVAASNGGISLTVMIPVGAIIYFILRKRLTLHPVNDGDQAQDIIEVDPPQPIVSETDSAEPPVTDNTNDDTDQNGSV